MVMADATNGSNGKADDAAAAAQPGQVQVQLLGQYIKDLSFENPNVTKMVEQRGENPEIRVEVNVNGQRTGADIYESAIHFRANAANKIGTIYELELVYAGLFRIQNIPEEALEPFLLVNCATLIFPFLRRIVADVTRDGGFPPLLLDPMDFGNLFMRRKQQEKAEAAVKAKS
jgi:preprotein translocase subunit SecB